MSICGNKYEDATGYTFTCTLGKGHVGKCRHESGFYGHDVVWDGTFETEEEQYWFDKYTSEGMPEEEVLKMMGLYKGVD